MSRGGLCTMQLLFLITTMLGKPLPLTFIVSGEGKQDIALLSQVFASLLPEFLPSSCPCCFPIQMKCSVGPLLVCCCNISIRVRCKTSPNRENPLFAIPRAIPGTDWKQERCLSPNKKTTRIIIRTSLDPTATQNAVEIVKPPFHATQSTLCFSEDLDIWVSLAVLLPFLPCALPRSPAAPTTPRGGEITFLKAAQNTWA